MKAHVRKTGQFYPQQPDARNSAGAVDGRVHGLRCLHTMGSAGHREFYFLIFIFVLLVYSKRT